MTNKSDGINAALTHYKAARDELITRVRLRDQVLLIYLGFTGAVTGIGLAESESTEIFLALPFLGLGCAILVSQHNSVIGALISYCTGDLKPFLVKKNEYAPEFVSSRTFKGHSQMSNRLRSIGHAIILLFPPIIGLGISFDHALNSPFPFGPTWWFGVICIAVAFYVILTAHGGRRSVYNDTNWDTKE